MIPIKKGPAPIELTNEVRKLKGTPGVTDLYARLRDSREPVLRSLVNEQGYLCAYCMRRISFRGEEGGSPATIEHVIPQRDSKGNRNVAASVDYGNMLAVCDGHEGRGATTCDKHRGNKPMTVNPLKSQTLNTVFYHSDGRIAAVDQKVNCDLNTTLNLNAAGTSLCEARRRVIVVINNHLKREFDKLPKGSNPKRKKAICEAMLKKVETAAPKKLEYLGVARYVLEKRVRRYSGGN